MKCSLNVSALAVLIAVAVPAWAQAPITPISPSDPASKSLGWIEAAPGSQTANPAPATTGTGGAPVSQMTNPAPVASEAGPAPGLQPANPTPLTAEAGAAPGSKKTNPASGMTRRAATPRPKQSQQHASEAREVRRDHARRASDNMANQLNRQQLSNLSAGSAVPAGARR